MPENSLKEENSKITWIFIVFCLTLYIIFQGGTLSWSGLFDTFNQMNVKGIVFTLSPIIAIVLTGIISAKNKARLVFWRWKNALPGHRVFTQIATKDSRINLEELKTKIGTLPKKPVEQNQMWYTIYKKHRNDITVRSEHKKFLLSRDLTAIATLFMVFGTIGLAFMNQDLMLTLSYFGLMFLIYIILSIVSQNSGKRFVCNVLAEHLS